MDAAGELFDGDLRGRILPFDHVAAVEYADIVLRRDREGNPISMADGQIAAICRASTHTLATRSIRDFDGTGVSLLNPWHG